MGKTFFGRKEMRMRSFADRVVDWQRYNRRAILPALALSLLYTVCINVFRDYQFSIQRLLPGWAVVFVLLCYAPRAFEKRRLVPFALFGGLVAFFVVAMRTVITPQGTPNPWQPWLLLPFAVFALTYALCGCGLSVLLDRISLRSSPGVQAPVGPKYWLWTFAIIMVCWLPIFAAFGPLRLSADSYVVISQAIGGNYLDDSHPVVYTLLVRLFLNLGLLLGNVMIGAYLFGLAQMVFLAAALSYSLYWMRRQGCPSLLCLVGLLYFTLSPVFALNGFTLWKDIPFNACLLLLMLMLWPVAHSRGQWLADNRNAAGFLVLCTAIVFLRGNGFPLLVVTFMVTVVAFRSQWKRLLCLFIPFLLVVSIVRGPLYAALGVTRLGSVEAAAMPLQQVSRAIAYGDAQLTPDQAALIESFVPLETIRENYQPSSPDYIKKHPDFNVEAFEESFGQFMLLWLQLAPQNLGEYTNAWLLQTLGYWKYDFGGRTAHLEEDYEDAFGIQSKDLVYRLTGINFRQFVADRTGFITLGMMAYILLFALAYLAATRRTRIALAYLPPLVVWLGLMIGAPTYCDFRYMLVFALALPVIIFMALAKAGGEGDAPLAVAAAVKESP